jgi:hypothetical protein
MVRSSLWAAASVFVLFLTIWPRALSAQSRTFDLRAASARYDIRLVMVAGCASPPWTESTCEGEGDVVISRRGSAAALQTLHLENVCVILDTPSGEPLVNSARLYDYQGTINVGDFNFDGQEDIAVQDGHSGPYGGPTYSVFLYSRRDGYFHFSDELSTLTREALGFFQVDANRRRLVTLAKSGCCYHVLTEYRVVDDKPIAVYRVVDDATGGKWVVETRERWVGGRWHRETRRRLREAEAPDP